MPPPRSLLFLSWTPEHGRSSGLAEAIGARAVFVGGPNYSPRTALVRYVDNARRTWRLLDEQRPRGVVVMLPPLPAALVAHVWARRRGAVVVLDAHTGVFNDPKWRWALRPTLWLARRCAVTVVTNDPLAEQVRMAGARALVLHNAPSRSAPESAGGGGVVVPCSWAADEPIEEVLAAAESLPDVPFSVTGTPRPGLAARYPGVRFTGFLSQEDFTGLLGTADVVMALTTRQHTMQQAGYEALERHVPLVTSDTAALREFFGRGAVFATPDEASIRAAITTAIQHRERLREEMRQLHAERLASWEDEIAALRSALHG